MQQKNKQARNSLEAASSKNMGVGMVKKIKVYPDYNIPEVITALYENNIEMEKIINKIDKKSNAIFKQLSKERDKLVFELKKWFK